MFYTFQNNVVHNQQIFGRAQGQVSDWGNLCCSKCLLHLQVILSNQRLVQVLIGPPKAIAQLNLPWSLAPTSGSNTVGSVNSQSGCCHQMEIFA